MSTDFIHSFSLCYAWEMYLHRLTSFCKSNIGKDYDKFLEELPEGFPEVPQDYLTALDEAPSG